MISLDRALVRGAAAVVTASLVAAASLRAQAAIITGPKAAVQRAVAATNAHTTAMQSPTAAAPTAAAPTTAAPAAGHPAAAAPTAKATPALTTTATKTVVHMPTTPTAPIAPAAASKTAAPLKPVTPVTTAKGKPVAGGKAVVAVAHAPSDSAARSISVTERGVKGEVSLVREVYSYDPGGRRDPFASLLRTGDLRPMLSDLRLVVVLYDPTGRNSIAIMRDVSTKDQYRVKVGQTVGRMRVAQIQPKEVVFTIEEVGFSRQEPLALGDSSTARTQ
jgi:hypothetical protein